MPRKRNNSWSRAKKQKQMTTARLIQISMRVDDYVYNHKPISESAAKSYLEEVTSLKEQCPNDERSLQVIEKLTRCMKAIITEYQDQRVDAYEISHGNTDPLHDARANSASPVYSMPDEDRSIFTQVEEGNAGIVEDVSMRQDTGIIDLCSDDDEILPNKITKSATEHNVNIDIEVDIQRGLSNLSLTQDRNPPNEFAEGIYSQSILQNYEDIDNNLQEQNVNSARNSSGDVNIVTNPNTVNNNFTLSETNMPMHTKETTHEINTGVTQTIITPNSIPLFSCNRFTDTQKEASGVTNINTVISVPLLNPVTGRMTASQQLVTNNETNLAASNYSNKIQFNKNIIAEKARKVNSIVQNTQSEPNIADTQTKQIIAKAVSSHVKSPIHMHNSQIQYTTASGAWHSANNKLTKTQDITNFNTQNINANNQGLMHPVHSKKDNNSKLTEDTQNQILNTQANSYNAQNIITQKLCKNANKERIIIIEDKTKIKKRRPRKKKFVEDENKVSNKVKKTPRKPKEIYEENNLQAQNNANSTKKTRQKSPNLAKKGPKIPIYNINVENDLSWIENIRYVREIERDEVDIKLNFDDFFWDNYNLPNNWNDNDFIY